MKNERADRSRADMPDALRAVRAAVIGWDHRGLPTAEVIAADRALRVRFLLSVIGGELPLRGWGAERSGNVRRMHQQRADRR